MARYSISRLVGPLFIWAVTVLAGLAVAGFRGADFETLLPVGLFLLAPALLTLLFLPVVQRDWGQAVILLIWTGFASVGALLGGPIGLWSLFLTVPIMGMLFFRGRVVEGFVLSAIALIGTYFGADYFGVLSSPLSEEALRLLSLIGIAATFALLIAGMIAATDNRAAIDASGSGSGIPWRQGVSGGLFEFDANNLLIDSNEKGRVHFGLQNLTNRPALSDLAADPSATAQILEAAHTARRTRSAKDARIALGPLASDFSHLDARFTPVEGGGLLLHTIDRSDEEVRLDALRQSHKAAEQEAADKTLFFAGVSHELRTPLNAIIGFSDMMRSRLFGPLPGKYAEYADLIHDSGQYMLDLIGDVLDLSKVEAGRYSLTLDTFDVSDVVRSSVKMIRPAADAADVAIEMDLPQDDVLLITADRKAVRQSLLNLLSNAVKFSPKGSHVRVAAMAQGGQMRLSVADQGPGMGADEIARIGQPYVQGAAGLSTEARGTGLGLALVRQLAELHGGQLELDSMQGRGTTAHLILPTEASR